MGYFFELPNAVSGDCVAAFCRVGRVQWKKRERKCKHQARQRLDHNYKMFFRIMAKTGRNQLCLSTPPALEGF
jgi:hypothetical protein